MTDIIEKDELKEKTESIFKNACFGKAYKTRDNRKFIYLGEIKSLFGNHSAIQGMVENDYLMYYYNKDGKSLYCEFSGAAINASNVDFEQVFCEEDHDDDIISEWKEEISDEELDRLANESIEYYGKYTYRQMNYNSELAEIKVDGYIDGFKEGYSKAIDAEKK